VERDCKAIQVPVVTIQPGRLCAELYTPLSSRDVRRGGVHINLRYYFGGVALSQARNPQVGIRQTTFPMHRRKNLEEGKKLRTDSSGSGQGPWGSPVNTIMNLRVLYT
jgi:hypothetical protein